MIREFRCPFDHITERILTPAEDADTESILCDLCHEYSVAQRIDPPTSLGYRRDHTVQP